MNRTALLAITIFISFWTPLHAQVPQLINYQGRVLVGTTNFNGTGKFKFALVNAAGTTTYWSNNGSSSAGSEPSAAVSVSVSNGLYSILLGDTTITNMTVAIPASVFNNSDVRLRVWFNDNTPNGSQLLSPDQRIASVGYAQMAANIVDSAITSSKIATGAVGSAQLANSGVSTNQIADNSITSAKISTGQVVKSVNGLSDAVTLSAGSNISITPSGNTLTLSSTGGGSSIWQLNATQYPYYNGGGFVGIGTNSPAAGLHIVNSNGNVLRLEGTFPHITLIDTGNSNAGTNVGAQAGGFYVSNNQTSATLMQLTPGGFMGIGTSTPQAPLQVTNLGAPWTSNGWKAAAEFDNATAISWQANSGNTRFGIGHTNGGLFVFRTASDPGNTSNPAKYDLCIIDTGAIGMGTLSPSSNLEVHGSSADVEETISNSAGEAVISLNSNVGGSNHVWTLESGLYSNTQNFGIYDRTTQKRGLEINATTGIVTVAAITVTGGSDVAEPFPMNEGVVEKGAVVVIDSEHPGRLRRSYRAYDHRVAGIVSGAGGVKPGIALHQEGALDGGENVALSGRVYVQAETSNGFIEPGDLLTTSDVPGHAMKATNHARAQGAVIGKAMSSLRDSRGTVLVLVTLQ